MQRLSEQREQNLARLRAYRDRGVFPLNEGHADSAVPIFVDMHGTACAVGHLMRCSGCEGEVDQIAATDLYVYVPDVESGPLVEWVLTSGLTQEEAALIQPTYAPPEATTPMSGLINSGAAVTMDAHWVDSEGQFHKSPDGLVFENFTWRAPLESNDSPLQSTDHFGVRTDFESVPSMGGPYWPDFLHANILTLSPLPGEFAVAEGEPDPPHYFWLSFDIVSSDPHSVIERVGVWLAPGFNFGIISAETLIVTDSAQVQFRERCRSCGDIELPPDFEVPPQLEDSLLPPTLTVENAEHLLGRVQIESWQDYLPDSYAASVLVDPIDRVTVHTLVRVGSRSDLFRTAMGGLSHTVGLTTVPEPATFGACLMFVFCRSLRRPIRTRLLRSGHI